MRKRTDEQLILKMEELAECDAVDYNGTFVHVWREINMFGFGETTTESRQDLLECLKEYYQDMVENQDSLGVIPTHDLEVLHKFFNWSDMMDTTNTDYSYLKDAITVLSYTLWSEFNNEPLCFPEEIRIHTRNTIPHELLFFQKIQN